MAGTKEQKLTWIRVYPTCRRLRDLDFFVCQPVEVTAEAVHLSPGVGGMGMQGGAVFHIRSISSGVKP